MIAFAAVQPLYSLTGLAVGLLVGMTGVGGGSLMTPLLILLFGIHPATAVGTDLLYAAATKTVGSTVHSAYGTIDWRLVRRLALGSVPMTVVTMVVLDHIGMEGVVVRNLITVVLTITLFVTALALLFREAIVARYAGRLARLRSTQIAVLTTAVGAVLGVLVSITSVGAGAIGVTALILLYPAMPTARLVGSDIAHAVPLTLAAGLGHWFLGAINIDVLFSLLLGSVPGILIGSYAAVRIPEKALRLVLAGTLIVVATKLSLDIRWVRSAGVPMTAITAH